MCVWERAFCIFHYLCSQAGTVTAKHFGGDGFLGSTIPSSRSRISHYTSLSRPSTFSSNGQLLGQEVQPQQVPVTPAHRQLSQVPMTEDHRLNFPCECNCVLDDSTWRSTLYLTQINSSSLPCVSGFMHTTADTLATQIIIYLDWPQAINRKHILGGGCRITVSMEYLHYALPAFFRWWTCWWSWTHCSQISHRNTYPARNFTFDNKLLFCFSMTLFSWNV